MGCTVVMVLSAQQAQQKQMLKFMVHVSQRRSHLALMHVPRNLGETLDMAGAAAGASDPGTSFATRLWRSMNMHEICRACGGGPTRDTENAAPSSATPTGSSERKGTPA